MTRRLTRKDALADIEHRSFDLIIIGAGINGTGIARDAAMRGLRVLLLDKGDIAGGTTSYSTRLIHGGLRYLEYAEIGLVRESLRERESLLRIAPHLVQPLNFLIPIYAGWRRGPGLIRVGMFAYDLLSFDKSLPWHRVLSPSATLGMEPGLNAAGLRGGARYADGQITFPERLALENALAAVDHGATVLTYARVEQLVHSDDKIFGVEFHDLMSGQHYKISAPLTINVAGPWVDDVLGDAGRERLIGGTKGTHIVVGSFPGAPSQALYIEAGVDQRPFFIVPWNGQYLIGTTDIPYDGDLNSVIPSEEEITYLIDETNRVILRAQITRADVHYAYAGVRPLPASGGTSTSGITRRHIIRDHAPEFDGLVSIIGGKITTYRSLAEETVNLAFRKLGRVAPRCATSTVPLPGATGVDWPDFSASFLSQSGLESALAERLIHLYGMFAWDIVDIGRKTEDLLQPFDPFSGAIGAEILFTIRREMAFTLTDILLRRTMAGLGPDAGLCAAERAVQIAVQYAGWIPERAQTELEEYRTYVEKFGPSSLNVPSRQ